MLKFISKIIIIFFTSIFLIQTQTFAEETCELKRWYDLYKCRVENICKKYIEWKKIIFQTEDYEEANNLWNSTLWTADNIDNAKNLYRENMNNIYKCAILQSQKNSLNLFKTKLIWIEKWWELKSKMLNKVWERINRIDSEFSRLWCKWIEKDQIVNKNAVLSQATNELCKHVSYMEYLLEYNKNIKNALWIDDESINETDDTQYPVEMVSQKMLEKKTKVDEEISHSYKVFPVAFNAYSEYENNYTLHIFLELIREDFLILRDKIHQALNPINQVVYKISNAMSIND